jgi:hypothetical protein
MSDSDLWKKADALRHAVEAHDLAAAGRSLEEYMADLRNSARTRDEIQSARSTLRWAMERVRGRRAYLVEFLRAYGPPPRRHTWHIDG